MLLTPYLFIHSRFTFSTGGGGETGCGGKKEWHASYHLLSPVTAGNVILFFLQGVYMIEADSHEPCACHRVHLSGLLRCGDTPVNLHAHQRLSHFTPSGQHTPPRKRWNACHPSMPFHVTRVKRTNQQKGVSLPLLRARTAVEIIIINLKKNHAEAAGCQQGDP